jgi:hypothetical protein
LQESQLKIAIMCLAFEFDFSVEAYGGFLPNKMQKYYVIIEKLRYFCVANPLFLKFVSSFMSKIWCYIPSTIRLFTLMNLENKMFQAISMRCK